MLRNWFDDDNEVIFKNDNASSQREKGIKSFLQ